MVEQLVGRDGSEKANDLLPDCVGQRSMAAVLLLQMAEVDETQEALLILLAAEALLAVVLVQT